MPEQHLVRRSLYIGIAVGCAVMGVTCIFIRGYIEQPLKVGYFLSNEANIAIWVFSNLALLWLACRRRLCRLAAYLFTVELAVGLAAQIIKRIPWEFYARPNGGGEGFPSGHAASGFSFAFMLTLFFPRLWWVWYGWAAAIAWSRVEINAHTHFQVAAGIVLGLSLAWLLAEKVFISRREIVPPASPSPSPPGAD